MVRMMMVMAVLTLAAGVAPRLAEAQTAGVSGQQNNQPSANQNQSQMQTNNAQQPGNARVLPPTADAQTKPNPLPELSK